MLSYLVSSVARRALLALLWTERLEASVSELARLGRVSNTAAQRELGLMREAGLACVRSVGSAHLYRANVDHPQAAVLESLLAPASPARARSPKNERLLAWLNYLGAPFWEPPPLPPPSREAALAAGVAAAKLDASLARALPVVFWKQRASLDWKELGYAAARVGVKHELGFFVDMAGVLAGSTGLRRRARLFRDRRRTTPRAFFSWPGAITRPFLEEESPPLAKRWGLLMDVGHDSFESYFKKHAFSD